MIEKEATGGPHKRSCVMLYFPEDVAKRVLKWGRENVKEEWLTGDGRETDVHVTVLYGIMSKDRADVEKFLPKGVVPVELGAISRFDTADEHDVIKIDVESDELHEIHEEMKDGVENDDEHPEYKPHVTIAYVKKGSGKDLDGSRPFDGIGLDLADLVWSPAGEGDDRKQHIDLGRETAEIAAALGADSTIRVGRRGWLWVPPGLCGPKGKF